MPLDPKTAGQQAAPAPFSTEPRFDRYGKILCIGTVLDRRTRKTWVVIRRERGSKAFAVTVTEWLGFSGKPIDRTSPANWAEQRLSVFGVA